MGILDKLRPQSKSTHPDPNIRIEAIHELDPADIESLNAFAKDDTDARVRRVAVARIGDASVLADIVRNESEGSVRDHALATETRRWFTRRIWGRCKHPFKAGLVLASRIDRGGFGRLIGINQRNRR